MVFLFCASFGFASPFNKSVIQISDSPSTFPFCKSCIAAEAITAEKSFLKFPLVATLQQGSHSSVKIRQCPDCSVKWVSVFEEHFSTTKGDSQYFSFVPLHDEEASQLINDKGSLSTIEKLSSNRRWLQLDYPAEKANRIRWVTGVFEFARFE
jgi:hypothetical protein